MRNHSVFYFLMILFGSKYSLGLEYSRQRYNANVDFLTHESGGNPVWSNKDNKEQGNTTNKGTKQDYNSQFPVLGASTATSQTTVNKPTNNVKAQPGGKRDYVAPNIPPKKNHGLSSSEIKHDIISQSPTQNSQSPKRDYVAPQYPTTKSQTPDSSTLTQRPQTSGKRDYIASQFTTQNSTQQYTGKVKDLIHFYDSKDKNEKGPQNVPSYSSILQGNKQGSVTGQTGTYDSPQPQPMRQPTPKPQSFSSVVSGPNKANTLPTSGNAENPATQRPSNNHLNVNRPGKPASSSINPVVLPSTLVNNNNQANTTSPADAEIQILSEELLRKDNNNAAKYVIINFQEKTTSQSKDDKAPLPLLTIAPEAWNIPTVQKFIPLLDNYERDTLVNEYITPQERIEENEFVDAIMSTAVIRHLMNFLKDKGYVSPDPKQQRDFLKQLWFNLYSRGKGKISSSGFEHVFVSELKNGEVQGLHNWIYFAREESSNRVNYLGYLKYLQLRDKGTVMKLHFNQQGVDKPVDSMFIGTSPELEMALYTLCFVTRADSDCQLKLGTKDVNIVTHTFRYRSKNYIGSAYPQI